MKKLQLFLLFCISIVTTPIYSQSSVLDKVTIKPSDESFIAATPDGGWLVSYSIKNDAAGFSYDGIQVLKYGGICQELEWSKEYQLGGAPINLGSMLRHSSGDIYLSGTAQPNDNEDLFLLKLSLDGSPNFFKTYNRPLQELIYTMDENPSGDLMLFGISYSNPTLPVNYFLTITPQGDVVQATSHAEAGIWGRGLACSDGGYIGRAGGTIFKVDADGSPLWSNFYAGISNSSAPVEVEGGYVFADSKLPSTSHEPHFLFKLDYNGDFIWISDTYQAKGYATLELLPNGNILCLDSYYDDANPDLYEASFLEFSQEGEQLSNQKVLKTYGLTSSVGREMEVLEDGSILFSTLSGIGNDTLYVGKTDPLRDFGCGTIENFNSEQNPVINYTILSIPNNTITFEVTDLELDVIDVALDLDQVCKQSDITFPTPPADTLICEGEEIWLRIDAPGAIVEWEDGSTADSFLVSSSGDYEVMVTLCDETMTLEPTRVTVEACTCDLVVPNAFTPDGDGQNDIFRVLTTCEVTDYQMEIFNRWGELVFTSVNPDVGWNGLKDGIPSPTDVYIYKYSYRFEREDNSEIAEEKGNITLIR